MKTREQLYRMNARTYPAAGGALVALHLVRVCRHVGHQSVVDVSRPVSAVHLGNDQVEVCDGLGHGL